MGCSREKASTQRRKTRKGKSRHTAFGQLAAMNDLPVEILLEIFCHTKPIDIVHITRTNTFLRQLVRNNGKIWRIARQNIGPDFPDCPSGISELKYAIFVFGKKCMICGASGPLERKHRFILRACYDCLWSTLLEISDPVYIKAYRMVSKACSHGICGLVVSTPGAVIGQWCGSTWMPPGKQGYDRSDTLELQRDLRQAKKVAEKRKVVDEWKLRFQVRSELRIRIKAWMVTNEPYVDEAEIFMDREYEIVERLRNVEGITEVAIQRFMSRRDKCHRHFVLQPHPLTDEDWKKMSPQLVALIGRSPETRNKQPRKR